MERRQKKARLSIDCTLEERRYIKMLAAREDKTISEFLMGLARKKMPQCAKSHVPNKKTIASIKQSRKSKESEEVKDLEGFWNSIGA